MIHTMDCIARVNAQDPDFPTFKKMDCIAHCNENENWNGRIMDCIAHITHVIVTACKSWEQGIRLKILIDDVNVSDAIIGSLSIQHDKNKISTFMLNLGDTRYSPRINSHIGLDKNVVITVYINRQEKRLFTGTIDEPGAEDTPAFRVIVPGRGYGKKLLDKKMTLISVQDLAMSNKRSDVIKYIAGQTGITNIDIPEMDPITIDNSFQGQSLWDMIRKEAMVEQYWVKFDEDGNLKLLLDEIKSDEDLYPTPDWSYNEDRFIRIGYKKSRIGINKIIVLGKTNKTIIQNWNESPFSLSESITWTAGENIEDYTANIGGFNITVQKTATFANLIKYMILFNVSEADIGAVHFQDVEGTVEITKGGASSPDWGSPSIYYNLLTQTPITITIHADRPRIQCTMTYSFTGKRYVQSSETRYDQISASITDPNSIEKYGEHDGGSITYPLLETVEQCIAVAKRIIRNNHKLEISNFDIPFNPLITTGQTISLTDRNIGLTERHLAEGVGHTIEVDDEGKIKARTQVRGVCYARLLRQTK